MSTTGSLATVGKYPCGCPKSAQRGSANGRICTPLYGWHDCTVPHPRGVHARPTDTYPGRP